VLLPSKIKKKIKLVLVSTTFVNFFAVAYLFEIVKMPKVDLEVAITGFPVYASSFKSHQSIQGRALVDPCHL
jgi:hypothetical protein